VPAHATRTAQKMLAEFAGLAFIFARLEPAVLLYLDILQAKVQATPHTNLIALRPFIAPELDQLVAEYIS
jgi:hypothetical protein